MNKPASLFCVLVIGVLFLFAPTLPFGFVNWDDEQNILRNPGLLISFRDHWLWSWRAQVLGVFQPLSWNAYWVQFGLGKGTPGIFHGVSVFLHLLVVASAIWVGKHFLPSDKKALPSGLLALLAGIFVFAVHPLRAEVVAWVSCQGYLWACLFGAWSWHFYLSASERTGKKARHLRAMSWILFLIGLLFKTMIYVLPLVFALSLFLLPNRPFRVSLLGKQIKKDAFFWMLTFGALVMAVRSRDLTYTSSQEQNISWAVLITLPFQVVGRFVWSTFFPVRLSPFYPAMEATWEAVAGWALILLFLTLCRRHWRSEKFWIFLSVVLVSLAPGVSSALTERVAFGDRFAQLPHLVFVILLPTLVVICETNWARATVSLLALTAAFGWTTKTRSLPVWRDSEALWTEATRHHAKETGKAYANLGTAFFEKGKMAAGGLTLQKAVRLDPKLSEAWNGIGIFEISVGQYARAIATLNRSLELKADYPEAMNNLASALLYTQDPQKALSWVEKALSHQGQTPQYHENRARILEALGRHEDALAQWRTLVTLIPNDPQAYVFLAESLRRKGNLSEAETNLGKAVSLAPYQPSFQLKLAQHYETTNQKDKAKALYENVLKLAPETEEATRGLERVKPKAP